MSSCYKIAARVSYIFKAGHKKGFGIHSPFVFSLLTSVFFEKYPYYCFDSLKIYRKKLSKNATKISLPTLGTGNERVEKVKQIVAKSVKPQRQQQLLFRLCLSNHSKTIIELGTNVGLTTQYLARCDSQAQVYTFEGADTLCQFAKKQFELNHLSNIQIIEGNIDDTLEPFVNTVDSLDFVFFDANHTKTATLKYFAICKEKAHKNSIFVFDDIHWSKNMSQAWEEIIEDKNITLSIDIYSMGIIWFKTNIPKQHYQIKI